MNAISGTRRQTRELVDGTLEVKIQIEPNQKAAFHQLFPEIDMPVALAPLVLDAKPIEPEPTKEKLGPLCMLAVQWCDDPVFIDWMYEKYSPLVTSPVEAKQYVLDLCNVTSRKELDTNPAAEKKFHDLIRKPYQAYLEGK